MRFFVKLLISLVLLLVSWGAYSALVYKSSSNTLVWEENFSDASYLDSYNSYIGVWIGGLRNDNILNWGWDGPLADIVVDRVNGKVYAVQENNPYSAFYSQPFSGNADFRYDVVAYKYSTSGVREWNFVSPVARKSTNVSLGGSSRFPSATVDDQGNLYVVYSDISLVPNQWYITLQKISNNGQVVWGSLSSDVVVINGTVNVQAKPVVSGSRVLVFYYAGNNIWARAFDKNTGNPVAGPVQVNTSAGNNFHPDAVLGPDGYVYVAWVNNTSGTRNIRGQKIDPNTLSRVTWGADSNDKTLNRFSGYSDADYWYGGTEGIVAVDMDSNTNLYVAFRLYRSGFGSKVFVQKIDRNANLLWNDGSGGDIKASQTSIPAEAYPDIAVSSDSVFVSWISHGVDNNDHMMLQRLDKSSGQRFWVTDKNLYRTSLLWHHGRIATDGTFVYAFANNSAVLQKIDKFGTLYFPTNSIRDRVYNGLATFRTKDLFNGVVVLSARLREYPAEYPQGANTIYYLSTEDSYANASANYQTFYNGDVKNFSDPKGHLYAFIVLSNLVNEGTNRILITNLVIEAINYYVGDGLVGKLSDGSDKIGNLILNNDASGQVVNEYVYNNGVNSAKGYIYVINNGTVSSNFKITATPGNSDWTVSYWLCVWDGNAWVTNQDITSTIIGSGFSTNLDPYVGGESNIVVIRAFLRPSTSLSSGANYTVYANIETLLPSGSWVFSDKVGVMGIVSSSRPDLAISFAETSGYVGLDVINSDGSGQTLNEVADLNVEKEFFVKVRNTGGAENIVLTATPGNSLWDIKYYTNNVDVTSDITGSGFTIYLNSDQEFSAVKVVVRPTNSSTPTNALQVINITARSQSDPTKEDLAKINIRHLVSKTELVVRKSNESWIGGGIFSTDYSQKVVDRIDNGQTNFYEISLTNLSSYTQDITLISSFSNGLSIGWDVKFFYGPTDITTQITGSGFVVRNIGETNEGSNITVWIISPSTYPTGANEIMGVYFTSIPRGDTNALSKRDTVAIETKLISTKVDGIVLSLYDTNGYNVITSDPISQQHYSYVYSNITYKVILSNPSPSSYEFLVSISNYSSVKWEIYVSNGSSDVTASITNVWTSSVIPPSGSVELTVFMKATNSQTGFYPSLGETNRLDITLLSPLKGDVVDRLAVFGEKALPNDLIIKSTNDNQYYGRLLYSTNASSVAQKISLSYPNTFSGFREFLIRIKNDRPVPEDTVLRGFEILKENNWVYEVYKYTGTSIDNPDYTLPGDWNNITSDVFNNGVTNSLTNSSDILFRIRVATNGYIENGNKVLLKFDLTSLSSKWVDTGEVEVIYGVGIPDVALVSNGVIKGLNVIVSNVSDIDTQTVTNFFDKAKGDILEIVISNRNPDISGVFNLKGDGDKDQWAIRYFTSSWVEISSSVTNNGYLVSVPANGSVSMYAVIKAIPNSTYSLGVTTNFDITVENDSGDKDIARIVAIITDRSIPDIYLSGGAWSNVFESLPSSQITNVYVGKGDTITNQFVVANTRNTNETNEIFAVIPSAADWTTTFELFIDGSWSNVTANITNSSDRLYITLGGTATTITGRVIMSLDVNTSLPFNSSEDVDISLTSEGKLKKDVVKLRYIHTDLGKPDIYSGSIGQNIYEPSSPTIQISDVEVEKEVSNTVTLGLANRRLDKDEDMKIRSFILDDTNILQMFELSTNGGSTWFDITSDITNNGYTVLIPASSEVLLKTRVYMLSTSTQGIDDSFNIDFKLYSFSGLSNDNFRVRYTVKDKSKPDIFVLTSGSNVFYPIPQSYTNFVEKGISLTQEVVLRNARSDKIDKFRLVGSSSVGDWSIKYIMNGNDVTSDVTGVGLWIENIPPLDMTNIQIEIVLTSNSSYTFTNFFANTLKLYSYTGLVRDEFVIVSRVDDKGRPDVFVSSSQNDVYSPNEQVYAIKQEKGETNLIYFYVQNDRLDLDENIKIISFISQFEGYDFVFETFTNGSWHDITTEITNTGFEIVISSSTILTNRVTVIVSNDNTNGSGFTNDIILRAWSQGRLVFDDVNVKSIIVNPKPDISVLPISGAGGTVGNDVYENSSNTSVNSVGNGFVLISLPSVYSVIVENDDVVDDTYVITAFGSLYVSNKWNVTIRDVNNVDITYLLANGYTNTINGGQSLVIPVYVSLINPDEVGIGESNVVYFKVQSLKNTNRVDFIKLVTTRVEVSVKAKVVEAVSGREVNNALFRVYESRSGNLVFSSTNNLDGTVSLKLMPGTYDIEVVRDGYVSYSKKYNIPEVLEYSIEDIKLIRLNLDVTKLDMHSFPNPVKSGEASMILLNVNVAGNVYVYITDLKGVVLKKFVDGVRLEKGVYQFNWNGRADDGSVLKRGVYMLVVNTPEGTLVKKIFIK